ELEGYLAGDGPALAAIRARLREDERLWDLLTSPLLVSFLTPTDSELPAPGQAAGPPVDGPAAIVSDYVQRLLDRRAGGRRDPGYRPDDTVRSLTWLGGAMRNEKVFSVDRMQVDLLPGAPVRLLVMAGP